MLTILKRGNQLTIEECLNLKDVNLWDHEIYESYYDYINNSLICVGCIAVV